MKIGRAPPDKEALLLEIDEPYFRAVFAAARLDSAEDRGVMDSAIESRWCGVTSEARNSFLYRKIFDKTDAQRYNMIRTSGAASFDQYALRSTANKDFGIGANEGSDCFELVILQFH